MRILENNGYANISGLKREFAIEVDGYDEKEKLIHTIFSKSRIANTELFALDVDIVKSLLASLDGIQVYPKDKSKNEVFKESTKEIELRCDDAFIPNGEYRLRRNVKGFGLVDGRATVKDGVFTLLKGSICGNIGQGYVPNVRKKAKIVNNILEEDVVCSNPSSAGWVIIGKCNNGLNGKMPMENPSRYIVVVSKRLDRTSNLIMGLTEKLNDREDVIEYGIIKR